MRRVRVMRRRKERVGLVFIVRMSIPLFISRSIVLNILKYFIVYFFEGEGYEKDVDSLCSSNNVIGD